MLDNRFQTDMQRLFEQIGKNVLKDGNEHAKIMFQRAPTKLARRCVTKINTKYNRRRLPSAANIVDLVCV